MTPEKILELAAEHETDTFEHVWWAFDRKALIAFAQSVIEAERESSYEPVAWLCKDGIRFNCEVEPKAGEPELPLYRHPPPELKLTDEARELFASIEIWINGEEE